MCDLYFQQCTCDDCTARDAYNEHVSPEEQRKQRRDHVIAVSSRTMREVAQFAQVPSGRHAKWLVNWFIKRALLIRGLSPIDSN